MFQSTLEITCAVLAPLSVMGSGLLMWTYVKIKKLREHPGSLVFMQCLTQCVLDLHWPLSIQTINKSINGIPCILLGASSCYFYFVTWNYTLGLSLEISTFRYGFGTFDVDLR